MSTKLTKSIRPRVTLCLSLCLLTLVQYLPAAEVKKEKKPSEFVFNEHEAKFLVHLAGKENQLKQMVALLGLAQAANSPKTPDELLVALLQERVTAKLPTIGDTVQNLKLIGVIKARDEVMLFRMGQHPEFKGQKPSNANYVYFKELENSLTKLINENQKAANKK